MEQVNALAAPQIPGRQFPMSEDGSCGEAVLGARNDDKLIYFGRAAENSVCPFSFYGVVVKYRYNN
jgi:hypothetical protein